MKIYIVMVENWYGEMCLFSLHKTEKGAEANASVAKARYKMGLAYVDVRELQE